MTLYVDSSALLKRYVNEPDSDRAEELLTSDQQLVTGRHTVVEVRRNLARLLDGTSLTDQRALFATDLGSFAIIELDRRTCDLAATIGERTLLRTLDALHVGAAQRLGRTVTFLTFDVRQAMVARQLGLTVVGA